MIKCKICGYTVKYRLIEHILSKHNLTLKEYKEQYGEYISEEYKNKVSNKSKEKWKEQEYREKRKKSLDKVWTEEKRKEHSKTIKEVYKNGFESWNKGLTKETDDRVKKIGEFNKKNLSGRSKEKFDYLKKHSDLMKKLWEEKDRSLTFNKEWMDEYRYKITKDKISKTLAEKISNGEIKYKKNRFINGYYHSNLMNEDFYYASNLELDAFKFLDNKCIYWTNKHHIIIEYKNKNNEVRRYIPDLYIDKYDLLIEMKGYDWKQETENKKKAALKKYKNYYVCYSIKDLEGVINEFFKN